MQCDDMVVTLAVRSGSRNESDLGAESEQIDPARRYMIRVERRQLLSSKQRMHSIIDQNKRAATAAK